MEKDKKPESVESKSLLADLVGARAALFQESRQIASLLDSRVGFVFAFSIALLVLAAAPTGADEGAQVQVLGIEAGEVSWRLLNGAVWLGLLYWLAELWLQLFMILSSVKNSEESAFSLIEVLTDHVEKILDVEENQIREDQNVAALKVQLDAIELSLKDTEFKKPSQIDHLKTQLSSIRSQLESTFVQSGTLISALESSVKDTKKYIWLKSVRIYLSLVIPSSIAIISMLYWTITFLN